MRSQVVIFLLLSISLGIQSQNFDSLLVIGDQLFENDKLEEALTKYQSVWNSSNTETQLKSIQGQIKTFVELNNIAAADSLVQIGISYKDRVDIQPFLQFELLQGEFYRNASQFDKALSTFRGIKRKLAKIPVDTFFNADLLFKTALTFEKTAAYDSSLVYIDSAFILFQKTLEPDDPRFISIYNGLGNTYYRSEKIDSAKIFYLKSKELALEKYGPLSSNLSIALANLSSISRREGKFQEAIGFSKQSLKIARVLKDKAGIASNYYALGVFYFYLGDYGTAKQYIQNCVSIREQIYDKNFYLLAGAYEVLAIINEESKDFVNARKYFSKSKNIRIANFGNESMEVAFSNENIGLNFKIADQLDSAAYYIELANKVLRKKFQTPDKSLGVNYFSLSEIQFLQKKYLLALRNINTSNEIYEAVGAIKSLEFAENLSLKGKIFDNLNEPKKAALAFEKSLDIISSQGKHNNTFRIEPATLKVLDGYVFHLYNIYYWSKNEDDFQKFETYVNKYLDLSDRLRKKYSDPFSKGIIISNTTSVYQRLLGIYANLYLDKKDSKYLKKVFQISEFGRSAQLRDIQNEGIQKYAGIPESVVQEEEKLKAEISNLEGQIFENPDSDSLNQELILVKERFENFVQDKIKKIPAYYRLKYESKIISLNEVQSNLIADQNIVEFIQDDSLYYALVITKKQTDLLTIGDINKVNNQIIELRNTILRRNQNNFKLRSRALYNSLWRPLKSKLSGERVIIIPTGGLFYLNFETLGEHNDPSTLILHDYNISYASSCDLFFSSETNGKNSSGSILAIAPGFEDQLKDQYKSELDSLEIPDQQFLETVRQPWSLKYVSQLSNNATIKTLTDISANEHEVKSQLPEGGIIHFATHAISDESEPLKSKLVLSKDIGKQNEDGYLHAYEIYSIPLNAELAVLSACESGIGKLQKGEGMISLAYSMNYAGCPSTAMSLWKVDEKANTKIIEYFFNEIETGIDRSAALRNAKLKYLSEAKGDQSAPFYWAGMVLMGKDGPITISTKMNWMMIFAGVLAIFVALFFLKRVFS